MSEYCAVLLETVSIQQYIFSSNRLKDNLGASYLVADIYKEPLKEALEEVCGQHFSYNQWRDDPDTINLLENGNQCFAEVGYEGGGNALIYFKDIIKAQKFVRLWSTKLLLEYPGIQTAVAVEYLPANYFDDSSSFICANKHLFTRLAKNKSYYHPRTVVPKHGITADCQESGYSAEVYNRGPEESDQRYISVVAKKKKDAAVKAIQEVEGKYKSLLNNEYTFTSRLDSLGQSTGESHLAVVHIDGNSMANRFRDIDNLPALRKLSTSVQNNTEEAFKKLLDYIINSQMRHLKKAQNGFHVGQENGKDILPLRYIVMGGDDITFVTDGRLGVHFAEKFMEYFAEKEASDGDYISSCAGVAIVKTKFPFFRAYELAEQLCNTAKEEARKEDNGTSWLDFHIGYGGYSGTIKDIRDKHYRAGKKSLLFGPYTISGSLTSSEKHIKYLKEGMLKLKNDWPRSKRKELRQILSLGEEGRAQLEDLKSRGLELPEAISGHTYHEKGWVNSKTPYYDMVELLEFYPDHCLP